MNYHIIAMDDLFYQLSWGLQNSYECKFWDSCIHSYGNSDIIEVLHLGII